VKIAIRPAAMFDGSPVSLFGFEEDVDIDRKERFDLPRDRKSRRKKVKDEDQNGETASVRNGKRNGETATGARRRMGRK
jgi:hypothetical protein